MARVSDECYAFNATFFDTQADLVRPFKLLYFVVDGTVELHDTNKKRVALKRCEVEGLRKEDMFVGNSVKLFGRSYKLISYADSFTEQSLGRVQKEYFFIIRPRSFGFCGNVLNKLRDVQCTLTRLRSCVLSGPQAADVLKTLGYQLPERRELEMELEGACLMATFLSIDPESSVSNVLEQLREHLFYSPDHKAAITSLFKPGPPLGSTSARNDGTTTMCLILPHAVKEGLTGPVLLAVSERYTITAAQMFVVKPEDAADYYEVYKTVVPEYEAMVKELSSGPCVAVEVSADKPVADLVREFREYAGHPDPSIASRTFPESLRGRFGTDKIRCGVMASTLVEDGPLEVEFFYSLLQQ